MYETYDTLVLSGGGIHGADMLGVLYYINEHTKIDLDSIKYYCGTSIGSFIIYLLIIGYEPLELFTYFCQIETTTVLTIKGVLEQHGLLDIEMFTKHLKILTKNKTGKEDLTYKELYDTFEKEMVVCTFNATEKKNEYFTYTNTPNMSCIESIRLSSAIPLVFKKQYYNDCLYIDGGLTHNFPIDCSFSPYTTRTKDDEDNIHILGIKSVEDIVSATNTNTLSEYLMFILLLLVELGSQYVLIPEGRTNIITIGENSPIKSTDFNASTKNKIILFNSGKDIAKEFFHMKKD